MNGWGLLALAVEGRTVCYPVWVAAMQEPYILACTFSGTFCHLDLGSNLLFFAVGPVISMVPAISTLSSLVISIHPGLVMALPPSLAPTTTRPVTLWLNDAIHTLTLVPTCCCLWSDIWQRSRDGLDPEQQQLLWELLMVFRDSFALGEWDVGQTYLVGPEINNSRWWGEKKHWHFCVDYRCLNAVMKKDSHTVHWRLSYCIWWGPLHGSLH